MSIQWVKFGLDAITSQWHFHMDLLDLWRNELAAVSLAAYVARNKKDLAALIRITQYYEMIIRLFVFDTGYEPLVCIYDGEIRSTPAAYEFFAKDPLYLSVSGKYYNAKQEDVWEQFSDQFVANLCLIWGLFLPEITIHALAVAPKDLFDSKANHTLNQRYNLLKNAGDFFKWASHAYSVTYKNYQPFVTSDAIWRLYNPLIDLYWFTIVSHIQLLKSLRAILPPGYIKPFIETQKTKVTLNDELILTYPLTGEGIIGTGIPAALITQPYNVVKFNTYGLILEIPIIKPNMVPFSRGRNGAGYWIDDNYQNIIDNTSGTVYARHTNPQERNDWLHFGVTCSLGTTKAWKVTLSGFATPTPGIRFMLEVGYHLELHPHFPIERFFFSGEGSHVFHIPPRENFTVAIEFYADATVTTGFDFGIRDAIIEEEEPLPPSAYDALWHYYG